MEQSLPQSHWKGTPFISIGGALVVTALLFILIPLTQDPGEVEGPDLLLRKTRISLPPPETLPPPPEQTSAPQPQTTLPQLPSATPPIEVQPLDLAFSPGFHEAVAIGTKPATFSFEGDAIAAVQAFFTFDDLNETPRLLTTPHFRFPQQLERRGVREGKVMVEIDILPNGSARFHRIISSTHQELEPVARRIIEGARFSAPIVRGQPQAVRGNFPVVLQN